MMLKGHEVEEAPNGAWWVRRPGTRLAWRFTNRREALAFVGQLHVPALDGKAEVEPPHGQRDTSAA